MDANNCFDLDLSHLSHRLGYLISVEARYKQGKSLLAALNNNQSQRADFETYLPEKTTLTSSYFIQPPMEYFGTGYSLHFDSISIGRVRTVNDLARVRVNPIPYRFLTRLKILKCNINPQPTTNNLKLISVDHPNPSYYHITYNREQITNNNSTTLVLSQSFDTGWHAYDISDQNSEFRIRLSRIFPFIFGKELKDHVLVNNWSNGWNLPNSEFSLPAGKAGNQNSGPTTIVIVYLPQYLQYLGFVLLISLFIYLLLCTNSELRRHKHIAEI